MLTHASRSRARGAWAGMPRPTLPSWAAGQRCERGARGSTQRRRSSHSRDDGEEIVLRKALTCNDGRPNLSRKLQAG